jgi:hypothetical protein
MMLRVFTENQQGEHVDALRRAVIAMNNCRPYRLTPEFDKLIEFDD